jgi:hypothetical protein
MTAEFRPIKHIRDSSRLNAKTLRELAEDPSRDGDWLQRRADEIDAFADELDQYLRARGSANDQSEPNVE